MIAEAAHPILSRPINPRLPLPPLPRPRTNSFRAAFLSAWRGGASKEEGEKKNKQEKSSSPSSSSSSKSSTSSGSGSGGSGSGSESGVQWRPHLACVRGSCVFVQESVNPIQPFDELWVNLTLPPEISQRLMEERERITSGVPSG